MMSAGDGNHEAGNARALERRVRQHVIGKEQRFFAVVQPGFEEVAREELSELGIRAFGAPVEGGIEFSARLDGGYRVNVASRTVTRVLMRLTTFKAVELGRFAKKVGEFPWELHLAAGTPVAFRITTRKSRLNRSDRLEEECLRAIAARLAKYGVTLAADGPAPQEIFVRVFDDRVTLSLDSSGDLLYLRGRKPNATPASLRETLAALILRAAGWPDYEILVDPMCGSGTFALEAGEIAAGRLANADREFAFLRWPAFRPAAYRHLVAGLREEAAAAARPGRRIVSLDIDARAVDATRRNLEVAGLPEALGADALPVVETDFLRYAGAPAAPEGARTLFVANPPYGKRLGDRVPRRIYRRLGEVLRSHPGAGFAVIVPGLDLEKVLAVGYDRKILFMNGGIRVALLVRRGRAPGEGRTT
jgi:putative N6-adenine-specific DNA methylase